MFLFLTVLQGIVAAALVGVILMQKSEGGGLGMGGGGSPSSIFSARGAGDFMTRTTTVLAVIFVALCIVLAGVAVNASTGGEIDTTLDRQVAPVPNAAAPLPTAAASEAPIATQTAPAQDPNDPLSGLAD
jgi:preprotein translocase subunit SecG